MQVGNVTFAPALPSREQAAYTADLVTILAGLIAIGLFARRYWGR